MDQLALFDYDSLDVEIGNFLRDTARRINERTRKIALDIWKNGRDFAEAQERLARHGRYDGGTFVQWAKQETGCSHQTVYRFIWVFQNFNFNNLLKLEIATSALYTLAAPSTPEEARQEAIERAGTGERITYSKAQEIVRTHRPEPIIIHPQEISRSELVPPVQSGRQPDESKMAVHFSSETDEHYTPLEIIEAALDCMGQIDLDPCSNSKEQPNVPASRHYTIEDDGLAQEWQGHVYMNPPYGRAIEQWVKKLCVEHEAGRVIEAVALVPARTDTQWWAQMRDYPVCLVEGRLKFTGDNPAPFPSAIFYLGNNIDRFYYTFCHLGDIWQRIEPGMFGG